MRYLLIIIIITLLSSCGRNCSVPGSYVFEIPIILSPAQETYQIGDTIRITSFFSDEVYERKTGIHYNLIDFKFYPEMQMREISDTTANEAALSDFEVLIPSEYDFQEYIYGSGSVAYSGEYKYENGNYELSYKIIPQSKGLFYFSFISSLATIDEYQDFEDKCPGESSSARAQLNDSADNNIHLLNESLDPFYNEWRLADPDGRFHRYASYCFRVVE